MKPMEVVNSKQKGYQGEKLVSEDYCKRGYTVIAKNFTIRGGEIDVIVEDETTRVFIEVKRVDYIKDFFDFLPKRKFQALRRSIEAYNHLHPTEKCVRLDVVFVRGSEIVQRYENVEF